ncbi:MAG: hypothetical protein WCL14_09055 [Bacteroidota bacterium]
MKLRTHGMSTQFRPISTQFELINSQFHRMSSQIHGISTQFERSNSQFHGISSQFKKVKLEFISPFQPAVRNFLQFNIGEGSAVRATCRQNIAPIVAAARCLVSVLGMQRLQRIAGRRWDEWRT